MRTDGRDRVVRGIKANTAHETTHLVETTRQPTDGAAPMLQINAELLCYLNEWLVAYRPVLKYHAIVCANYTEY